MKKYFFVFFAIVVLDQITKILVVKTMDLYQSIPVVDGFFNLTYILNPGAAFGIMAELDDSFRQLFFIIVTIAAIIVVSVLAYKERIHRLRFFSYVLIISGAFGNLIDRIYIGKVIDFFDFYVGHYHWPAFNIADSSISVGIFLLIVDLLFVKEGKIENKT